MSQGTDVTPQAAILRVLINGESEAAEIIRKVHDWTEGQIQFDEQTFASAIANLESEGLVERRTGIPDKQTGQARPGFTLTPAGRSSALEVLAASLTRKA